MKSNKNIVRLTEGQLYNIIVESVDRVLRESDDWSKIQSQRGEERVPSWSLNYLINGEKGALSHEEIAEIDNWRRASIYDICPPEGEQYFCRYPAFGEPCDVYDCVCFYRL